jgi:hypothetical protein
MFRAVYVSRSAFADVLDEPVTGYGAADKIVRGHWPAKLLNSASPSKFAVYAAADCDACA